MKKKLSFRNTKFIKLFRTAIVGPSFDFKVYSVTCDENNVSFSLEHFNSFYGFLGLLICLVVFIYSYTLQSCSPLLEGIMHACWSTLLASCSYLCSPRMPQLITLSGKTSFNDIQCWYYLWRNKEQCFNVCYFTCHPFNIVSNYSLKVYGLFYQDHVPTAKLYLIVRTSVILILSGVFANIIL